jgi:hypothetical protein
MVKIRVPFRFFVLITFTLTISAVTHAQATRTCVSGVALRVANSSVAYSSTTDGTSGTVDSFANNQFIGNAGSSAVTGINVRSYDTGQQ